MNVRRVMSGLLAVLLLVLASCDPEGNVDSMVSVTGGTEKIRVKGWAWDPDAPGTPVKIRVVVDGVTRGTGTADRYRLDVFVANPDAGRYTGYDITVPTTAGSHYVCVIAENVAGTDGDDTLLGSCRTVKVAASTLPKILEFDVVGDSGNAPHTVLVGWDLSTPANNSPTCRINWDGGAYDQTIKNCDDLWLTSHTYTEWGRETIRLEVDDGINPPVTTSLQVMVTTGWEEPFDITRRYTGLTAAQETAIETGIDRWESVIPVGVPSVFAAATDEDICDPASATVDETIDDVIIDISVEAIDGPGGILAGAGPCLIRDASSVDGYGDFIPAYGTLVVDSDDVEDLRVAGLLDDVAAHETGHVLGFGASLVWDFYLFDAGTPDPRYWGFFGWSRATDPEGIAVENVGGVGSADSHWRESRYGDELMTSEIDPSNTLSSMTIGVLADLGYRVDFNQAEAHPGTTFRGADQGLHLEELLFTPKREI